MTKKMNFENEQVDAVKYTSKLAELENEGSYLESALKVLEDNKLPTTEKFIREHLLSEIALRLYFNQLAKSDLEKIGGLMADETEKEKIVSEYKRLFESVKPTIKVFNNTFNKERIKVKADEHGRLTYDQEYNKTAARLYAGYTIDGASLSSYRDMCLKMYESRKKLKEFEEKHGIKQNFGLGTPYTYSDTFGQTSVLREMRIDDYFENHDSDILWLQMFGKMFLSNGIKKVSNEEGTNNR